jgi:hypothetical protein
MDSCAAFTLEDALLDMCTARQHFAVVGRRGWLSLGRDPR